MMMGLRQVTAFSSGGSLPWGSGANYRPLHPGFSLGSEYAYAGSRRGLLFQSLAGGYHYNKHIARALFLQTSLGYRYTLGFGLFGDISLGVGYLHSFHPCPIFALNAQGDYERVKDKGRGGFIALGALGGSAMISAGKPAGRSACFSATSPISRRNTAWTHPSGPNP